MISANNPFYVYHLVDEGKFGFYSLFWIAKLHLTEGLIRDKEYAKLICMKKERLYSVAERRQPEQKWLFELTTKFSPQEFYDSRHLHVGIRKQQDCSSWLHITTYVQDTLARQWLQPTSWWLFTEQREKKNTKSEVQFLNGTFQIASPYFSLEVPAYPSLFQRTQEAIKKQEKNSSSYEFWRFLTRAAL